MTQKASKSEYMMRGDDAQLPESLSCMIEYSTLCLSYLYTTVLIGGGNLVSDVDVM